MNVRFFLLVTAIAGLPASALAEEAALSDPIAKAPELVLRDLVPAAILEKVGTPFNLQAEVASNTADAPFQVTFDIVLPDYPNATFSLLVSERETATGVISRVLAMAASGNLPGGSSADPDVLAETGCVGIVDQTSINCMIGTAGVQFAASDFTGGDSVGYDAAKALFSTLPLENYRKVFGR